MKIFICTSKHFYHKVPPIMKKLESFGHVVTPPNTYSDPFKEERMKKISKKDHIKWKSKMIRLQEKKVRSNDAVLILNFTKNGQKNYIGGGTFLETFRAFDLNKRIYLWNPIPDNTFKDELTAMQPIILNGDLSKLKKVKI